ncbi:MAG: alkaline phytoceramidase [Candidatus Lambdaproteobacteria bacterium]|nr:alkaline phytoceramidase [Candidatus Lambdaproteobacteria bacterium]
MTEHGRAGAPGIPEPGLPEAGPSATRRRWVLQGAGLALLAAAVAFLALVPPIPQSTAYHSFADQRQLWGVPNAWNVASNIPFLLVGLAGLWSLLARRPSVAFAQPVERWPWLSFFAALALTGIGSAVYHWRPTNATLLWDRLPLALTFMAVLAALIGEHSGARLGSRVATVALPLLLIAGAASVLYWHGTELRGAGDLRPYIIVQAAPLIWAPVALLLYPARYSHGRTYLIALAFYLSAKGFETLDGPLYAAGEIVGGHAVKHLLAATAAWRLLDMLRVRRLLDVGGARSAGWAVDATDRAGRGAGGAADR